MAQGGFRLALNVLIGRAGGAQVLGQSAGILATAQFLTLLGPSSFGAALTRFVASAKGDEDTVSAYRSGVLHHVRRRLLLIGAVMTLAIPLIWGLLLSVPGENVLILFGVTAGLIAYGHAKSHLLGLGKIPRLAVSEVFTAGVGTLAALVLIWAGVRDLTLLWPVAGTAWLCAGLCWILNGRHTRLKQADAHEIDHFALLGVLGTLVSAGFLQASVIVASHLGGAPAGHYAAAFALATPLSLVTTSVSLVLFPRFSSLPKDGLQSAALLGKALDAMIKLLIPAMCLAMLLAREIITLVWGAGYEHSALLLAPLMCAVAMNGVGMPASQALTSTGTGGMRTSVLLGASGAATGVVAWALLVPKFDVSGLAIGYLIGTAVTSSLPLVLMGRRMALPWVPSLIRGWVTPATVAIASMTLEAGKAGNSERVLVAFTILGGWTGAWWLIQRRR